jgi:hypothetical protein
VRLLPCMPSSTNSILSRCWPTLASWPAVSLVVTLDIMQDAYLLLSCLHCCPLTLRLLSLCRRSQAAWQLAKQQHKLINTSSLMKQDAQTLQRVKHANTVRLQYDQAACDQVRPAADAALATVLHKLDCGSLDLLQPSVISMVSPLCKCKEPQPQLCSCQQHLLPGMAGHQMGWQVPCLLYAASARESLAAAAATAALAVCRCCDV